MLSDWKNFQIHFNTDANPLKSHLFHKGDRIKYESDILQSKIWVLLRGHEIGTLQVLVLN